MKRLVIGDIHGHFSTLESIYNSENPDSVIVLGDYFDSFGVSHDKMPVNFNKTLELREKHINAGKGEFILLLGNHDFHYIDSIDRYSGYNYRYAAFAKMKINECMDSGIITLIYTDDVNKTIYSHAGISNTWMRNSRITDISDINSINLKYLRHTGTDPYGRDFNNGPLWIRPGALLNDIYKDENDYIWTQIVGHTNSNYPLLVFEDLTFTYYNEETVYDKRIVLYTIDTLPNFYIVEELDEAGKLISRNIKNNNLSVKKY